MKFEKIVVELLQPKGSGLTLKNVVQLANVGYNNQRQSTYYSSSYMDTTGKYADHNQMSILYVKRREFLVFSAKSVSEETNKRSLDVYFSHPHMYTIARAFKRAATWLDEHKDKVFAEGVDGLCVVDKYADAEIRITSDQGGHISIQPSVIEENDVEYAGVAIFVGDFQHCCNIIGDRFLNFAYYIEQFNLGNQSMQSLNFALINDALSPSVSKGGSSNKASQTPKRVIRTKASKV